MNMSSTRARWQLLSPWVIVLLSMVVVIFIYRQALHYPFISDDVIQISENSKLANLPAGMLWKLLTEPYNSMSEFLPVRELSYWFDMQLSGQDPYGFHIHNILLYLVCLPLVYGNTLWLWRYFRAADVASAPWVAAAVTALFALHASHAEAVTWVSGRKDLLSGMFSLLALWLAMRAKRDHGLSTPLAVAALFALMAAMLSKAAVVVVAPLISMLWLIFWRDTPKSWRRYPMLLWPLASLLLAAYIALVFSTIYPAKIPFYFGAEAVVRSLAVFGWFTRLSVSPENRHYFYPVLDDASLPLMVIFGAAALAVVVRGGMMILRRRSIEGFSLVAFFLLCVPSLQLVPYAPPSLVSDRYVFLAVWPVILLLVSLVWRLTVVPRVAILLVIALAWGMQAANRTTDWRSPEAMIDTDLRAYPGLYLPAAYKILYVQLPQKLTKGANETAKSITNPEFRNILTGIIQASTEVNIATASKGEHQKAMSLLWKLGLDLKQPPSQVGWNSPVYNLWKKCQHAIAIEWSHLAGSFQDDPSIFYSAGLWSLELNYFDDAAFYLTTATQSPNLAQSLRGTAFKSLGLALMNSEDVGQAEAPLRAALMQSPPDLRAYCALSEVYRRTNRPAEAAQALANCVKVT